VRSFKQNNGPFSERIHLSLDEIDRICVEALRDAKCLPDTPSPVRIDRFIEKQFGCAVGYEPLAQGILGCTVFGATGRVEAVFVASDLDDGSQSGERSLLSTLAHEAGHGLLHAQLFIRSRQIQDRFGFEEKQKPQDRILCRAADIGGVEAKRAYDGKWWEYQANRAIGGLLLPKKLVVSAAEHVLKISEATGVAIIPRQTRPETIRAITEIFDVNPIVARIRLAEMWPEAEQTGLI